MLQFDKLRRDFLCKGNRKNKKFHHIMLLHITLSEYLGSLGIRNIAGHNRALLMKRLWRFNNEDGCSLERSGFCKT